MFRRVPIDCRWTWRDAFGRKEAKQSRTSANANCRWTERESERVDRRRQHFNKSLEEEEEDETIRERESSFVTVEWPDGFGRRSSPVGGSDRIEIISFEITEDHYSRSEDSPWSKRHVFDLLHRAEDQFAILPEEFPRRDTKEWPDRRHSSEDEGIHWIAQGHPYHCKDERMRKNNGRPSLLTVEWERDENRAQSIHRRSISFQLSF